MNTLIAYIAYFMAAGGYVGEPINRAEVYCTAQAIYHEARGEPIMGQVAVGWVIQNRIDSSRYADEACAVVHRPHQFTNIKRSGFTPENKEAWRTAVEVAVMVRTGLINDPTNGALNYYAARGVNAIPDPWPSMIVMADIGNHRFKNEQENG